MILAIFACFTASAREDVTTFFMIRNWVGNWSIECHQISTQNGNSQYVRNYWGIVVRYDNVHFDVLICDSNTSTNPLKKYSFEVHSKYFEMNDGRQIRRHEILPSFEYNLQTTGKYDNYLFDFILATKYRYHLSLFDQETKEWLHFTMIKADVDRSEPTFMQQNFWVIFGILVIMGANCVLFLSGFGKVNKMAEERDKQIKKEQKMAKPEFEDVLSGDQVKKRIVVSTYEKKD